MKFYYKYLKNELPSYFNNLFAVQYPDHQYKTRQQNIPILYTPKHAPSKKSIRFYIPRLLKTMPDRINEKLHTHSLYGFSQYLKVFLISNYKTVCHYPNCYICGR